MRACVQYLRQALSAGRFSPDADAPESASTAAQAVAEETEETKLVNKVRLLWLRLV